MREAVALAPAKDRVARGARWLDKHVPGWYRHIHLPQFDIADGAQCVWGQLARNNLEEWFGPVNTRNPYYSRGLNDRGYNVVRSYLLQRRNLMRPFADSYTFMVALGFTAGTLGPEATTTTFGELQAQWEHVVGARQATDREAQQTQ